MGTLYGIEVPFRRDIDARRLVPCAIAAASSFVMRDALAGARHLIVLDAVPITDTTFVAGVVMVGIFLWWDKMPFASVCSSVD